MRQAVVVIHGIGEQRPMDTVRGFVEAVMPQPKNPGKPKFWSKPDPMSETFELRKLTTPQTQSVPPTDFYEYYWAYQAEGTRFEHVRAWAWSLLMRRPGNVPKHLKPLWYTLWFLILATVVVMSSPLWSKLLSLEKQIVNHNFLLSFIPGLILLFISSVIVNYVGDAARYLNPSPTNIEMRRRIRKEGVDLLKKLHECNLYDRIIVVGHSLGSVIAYDILKNAWPLYNTIHPVFPQAGQKALRDAEETARKLQATPTPSLAAKFLEEQPALWVEERGLKNPWLVTDLITVGSPLAHAELLLARSNKELLERQAERELPTCPPFLEDGFFSYPPLDKAKNQSRIVFSLHHAALFACTRWTNLYFPAALGFFGDLVGGPLRGVFGPGIQDVAVDSAERGGLLQHTPLIHTHYWSETSVPQGTPPESKLWALTALRTALDLESRALLRDTQSKAAAGQA
jgi:hypothetical protein